MHKHSIFYWLFGTWFAVVYVASVLLVITFRQNLNMKELSEKGALGYEHVSTKVASYVNECKGSAVLAQSLEVLNSYRKKLLSECNDKKVLEAKKST